MDKSYRKCAPKAQTFLNFCEITQNSHCMQEILLIIDILKEDYQKALKKLTLFVLLSPVPFNGQRYEKNKGSGTSDQ